MREQRGLQYVGALMRLNRQYKCVRTRALEIRALEIRAFGRFRGQKLHLGCITNRSRGVCAHVLKRAQTLEHAMMTKREYRQTTCFQRRGRSESHECALARA